MYLTFDQVTLIGDKRKAREGDPVVYVRAYRGDRILTLDGGPSAHAGPATRSGVLYYDAADRVCVVPDQWDDVDAQRARLAIDEEA